MIAPSPRLSPLAPALAVLLVAAGVYELVRSPAFPLRVIRVEGDLARVERAAIVEPVRAMARK